MHALSSSLTLSFCLRLNDSWIRPFEKFVLRSYGPRYSACILSGALSVLLRFLLYSFKLLEIGQFNYCSASSGLDKKSEFVVFFIKTLIKHSSYVNQSGGCLYLHFWDFSLFYFRPISIIFYHSRISSTWYKFNFIRFILKFILFARFLSANCF